MFGFFNLFIYKPYAQQTNATLGVSREYAKDCVNRNQVGGSIKTHLIFCIFSVWFPESHLLKKIHLWINLEKLLKTVAS